MKSMFVKLMSTVMLFGALAFAQSGDATKQHDMKKDDSMKQDDGKKDDSMKHDEMKSGDTMKKGDMAKIPRRKSPKRQKKTK